MTRWSRICPWAARRGGRELKSEDVCAASATSGCVKPRVRMGSARIERTSGDDRAAAGGADAAAQFLASVKPPESGWGSARTERTIGDCRARADALRQLRQFLRIRSRFPPSPEAVPDVVLTEIDSNGSRSREASYEHAPSDCQLDVIDFADLQSSRAEPRSRT